MRNRFLITAMVLAGIIHVQTAMAQTAPVAATLEVQGLRIVKPAPGGNDRLRAFNWSPGITMALLVRAPQGGLIAVDRDASKVTSVVDDKGKDLSKAEQKDDFGRDEVSWDMSPEISPDGKICALDVNIPGLPGKGATTLTAAGTLVLVTGTQKKDFASEVVTMAPDTKVNAGRIPLTITKIGKPEWGDDEYKFAITLQAKQKLDDIVDIQFFDATGQKLETKQGTSGSMRFGSDVTVDREYLFKNKVAAAKVVVTYWMDKKAIPVPFKLTVGVGL